MERIYFWWLISNLWMPLWNYTLLVCITIKRKWLFGGATIIWYFCFPGYYTFSLPCPLRYYPPRPTPWRIAGLSSSGLPPPSPHIGSRSPDPPLTWRLRPRRRPSPPLPSWSSFLLSSPRTVTSHSGSTDAAGGCSYSITSSWIHHLLCYRCRPPPNSGVGDEKTMIQCILVV